MSQDITYHAIKREIKKTFSLSVPLIASQLVYASSGFIGTAMVAHLGEDALAASVLVSTIWMTLFVIFFGVLNAAGVLVAHQYGAKNNKAISEIMGQVYLLGIGIIILIMLMLFSLKLLLHLFHQPPPVEHLAYRYLNALIWTVPGLVILVIGEQFLAGIGHAKRVLQMSVAIVPVEIALIYLLVFGRFGLPDCGIAGIGYGFAVTYTLSAIGLTLYLVKSKQYTQFGVLKRVTCINLRYIKELLRVGVPLGLMNVIELSTFTMATWWMARYGTTLLAAHQIVMQYIIFAITIVFAMSQAVTVRVGHAVGKQDLLGIRCAVYIGMLLNFCIMIFVSIAFYFFPLALLKLDLNVYDPVNIALVRDASVLLSICSVLLLFDNFRIIGFGALRGLKDTRFPMFASFVGFWLIGLTSAFLFSFSLNWEGQGIWWGITLGIACGAIIIFMRLQYLLRRVDLAKLVHI